MIRLCNISALNIQKKQLNLEILNEYFAKEPYGMINIYNEDGTFYGYAKKEDIGKSEHIYECVNTEKVIFNNAFFCEAKKIVRSDCNKFIPVVDEQGSLIHFCFNENDFRYDQVMGFLNILNNSDYSVDLRKYLEDAPQTIYIQGLNEISYELSRALYKNKSDFFLIGEEWKRLFDRENIISGKDNRDLKNGFLLFAENSGQHIEIRNINEEISPVGENFRKIIQAAINVGKVQLNKSLKYISKEAEICFCSIPLLKPFTNKWSEEFSRVEDVHNKIQGYKTYKSEEERNCVRQIYGHSGYPFENRLADEVIFSIDKWFVGSSYLKNREKNRLYIIGPCIVRGYCVPDYMTISNELQRKIQHNEYEVVRIVTSKVNWILMDNLEKIPIRSRDIIIFISEEDSLPKMVESNHIVTLDLNECYKNMNHAEAIFSDCPIHVNGRGHAILAQYIYDKYLQTKIADLSKKEICYIQFGDVLSKENKQGIKEYVEKYRDIECCGKIGAIVMNCNPFTKGHQFLIEEAALRVDWLYIFVVEEDKSFFSFKDRMELVKRGTNHIHNLKVIPSGRFVLSYQTLPSYFEKETYNKRKIDASNDIELFARYIAPGFSIRYRFVGEEPLDLITKQYNDQMKEILPQFGIEFIEIPREKMEDQVISASRVRKAIKEENWELVDKLVPGSTKKYLETQRNFK